MRLDPTSLKLFISVVEEGTIAAAADREHIAASAVSKRIGELEASLCTELLSRTNKGVEHYHDPGRWHLTVITGPNCSWNLRAVTA